MTHDWIATLLALGFFAATAAFFVMWSKMEEWKEKCKDEHESYLAALRIGNANAEYAQRLEDEKERSTDYSGLYAKQKEAWRCELDRLWKERNAMQDRLSALLCPMNDHVWKDGRCVKCGRVQDD